MHGVVEQQDRGAFAVERGQNRVEPGVVDVARRFGVKQLFGRTRRARPARWTRLARSPTAPSGTSIVHALSACRASVTCAAAPREGRWPRTPKYTAMSRRRRLNLGPMVGGNLLGGSRVTRRLFRRPHQALSAGSHGCPVVARGALFSRATLRACCLGRECPAVFASQII